MKIINKLVKKLKVIMKMTNKLVVALILAIPIPIFAHDGHVHTGTFWENIVHFMYTNIYLFIVLIVIGGLLFRHMNSKNGRLTER